MIRFAAVVIAIATTALAGCQSTSDKSSPEGIAKVRSAIDQHAEATLAKLYAEKPELRKEVESAAGYAIFDLSAVNVVLVVGQQGKGVMVDNKGKARTYMKALRAGTGPGLGYQQLSQVFVFKNATALEQFKVGGGLGGDVSASATLGTANVQQSFNPYISTYQFTEKGFAVQANWGGTAYVVDTDLN